MNYSGRVLAQQFSGDFLKEALRHAGPDMPYRVSEYYQSSEYTYKCSVAGDFSWFQGYEEIFHNTEKVYECYTILRLKPHNLSGLICVKLRCRLCLASAKLHPPPCFTQIILGNLCELLIKD